MNKQMLQLKIAELEAKVLLHEVLLQSHIQRDIEERRFYMDMYSTLKRAAGEHPKDGSAIREPKYLQVLKQYYKANEDILRVQLSELQVQLKMYQAMLSEAEKSVVIAGPGSVV